MRTKRYLLTCVVLFLVALIWNGLVHFVLLRQVDASVQHLFRADFQEKAWLSLVVTAGMIALFVWGYGRFARDASAAESARYGLFFGLLAGLFVDLNQYVLYPLPARVVALWFVGGMIEFQLYAFLVRKLSPPASSG